MSFCMHIDTITCPSCERYRLDADPRGPYPPHINHEAEALRERNAQLEARLREALKVIEDFAECGTRHDLQPTKRQPVGGWSEQQVRDNEQWWHRYLQSMDASVCERAKKFLAQTKSQSEAAPSVDQLVDPRVAGSNPASGAASLPNPPEMTPELLAQIEREGEQCAKDCERATAKMELTGTGPHSGANEVLSLNELHRELFERNGAWMHVIKGSHEALRAQLAEAQKRAEAAEARCDELAFERDKLRVELKDTAAAKDELHFLYSATFRKLEAELAEARGALKLSEDELVRVELRLANALKQISGVVCPRCNGYGLEPYPETGGKGYDEPMGPCKECQK